jgi:hypothetical protein
MSKNEIMVKSEILEAMLDNNNHRYQYGIISKPLSRHSPYV